MTDVKGTQITAKRDDTTRTRDAQKFKKVKIVDPKVYQRHRQPIVVHADNNASFSFYPQQSHAASKEETLPNHNTAAAAVEPPRKIIQNGYPNGHLEPNVPIDLERSQRTRAPPQRYGSSLR